jgi:hypothetical protein
MLDFLLSARQDAATAKRFLGKDLVAKIRGPTSAGARLSKPEQASLPPVWPGLSRSCLSRKSPAADGDRFRRVWKAGMLRPARCIVPRSSASLAGRPEGHSPGTNEKDRNCASARGCPVLQRPPRRRSMPGGPGSFQRRRARKRPMPCTQVGDVQIATRKRVAMDGPREACILSVVPVRIERIPRTTKETWVNSRILVRMATPSFRVLRLTRLWTGRRRFLCPAEYSVIRLA